MRIIKYLLIIVLILLILSPFEYQLMKKYLLWKTTNQIRDDLRRVQSYRTDRNTIARCKKLIKNDLNGGKYSPVSQLRFISDTEYNLEVVCGDYVQKPITKTMKRLPIFVKKVSNSAGFLWDRKEISGITLDALGEQASMWLDGYEIKTTLDAFDKDEVAVIPNFTIGPIANCAGYGYECCDVFSQKGMGQQNKYNLDCEDNCYAQCVDLPVVLKFDTQPFKLPNKDVLNIAEGQKVIFDYHAVSRLNNQQEIIEERNETVSEMIVNYLMKMKNLITDKKDEVKQENIKVEINYGDGEADEFTLLQGRAEHVYTCINRPCLYEANINVIVDGLQSKSSHITKINIKVE